MEGVFIIGMLVSYCILYFIIRWAVRDGIIDARNRNSVNKLSQSDAPQIICPNCNLQHDFDYPKCPNCGHEYY